MKAWFNSLRKRTTTTNNDTRKNVDEKHNSMFVADHVVSPIVFLFDEYINGSGSSSGGGAIVNHDDVLNRIKEALNVCTVDDLSRMKSKLVEFLRCVSVNFVNAIRSTSTDQLTSSVVNGSVISRSVWPHAVYNLELLRMVTELVLDQECAQGVNQGHVPSVFVQLLMSFATLDEHEAPTTTTADTNDDDNDHVDNVVDTVSTLNPIVENDHVNNNVDDGDNEVDEEDDEEGFVGLELTNPDSVFRNTQIEQPKQEPAEINEPAPQEDVVALSVRQVCFQIANFLCRMCQFSCTALELVRSNSLSLLVPSSASNVAPWYEWVSLLMFHRLVMRAQIGKLAVVLAYCQRHDVMKRVLSGIGAQPSVCVATSMFAIVVHFLRDSCHGSSSALVSMFSDGDGYVILEQLIVKIMSLTTDECASAYTGMSVYQESEQCEWLCKDDQFLLHSSQQCVDEVLNIVNDLCFVGAKELQLPKDRDVIGVAAGANATEAAEFRLKNMRAFEMFHTIFYNDISSDVRMQILNRILMIVSSHTHNFWLIQKLHTIPQFIEYMPNLQIEVQHSVMKILDYVVSVVPSPPFQELCTLTLLLKSRDTAAVWQIEGKQRPRSSWPLIDQEEAPSSSPPTTTTADKASREPSKVFAPIATVELVLSSINRYVRSDSSYRDVLRDSGMLDILTFHLSQLAKHEHDTERQSLLLLDMKTYELALDTLACLIEGNAVNMKIFREFGGQSSVYQLVKDVRRRALALAFLERLPNRHNVLEMLEVLQCTSTIDSMLQIDLLRALCTFLQSQRVREMWQEISGFECIFSVLVRSQDQSDEVTFEVMKQCFQVMRSAVCGHPQNRLYLWSENAWQTIATAMRISGVIQDAKSVETACDCVVQLMLESDLSLNSSPHPFTVVRNGEAALILIDILSHIPDKGVQYRILRLVHRLSQQSDRNKQVLCDVGVLWACLKQLGLPYLQHNVCDSEDACLGSTVLDLIETLGGHCFSGAEFREFVGILPLLPCPNVCGGGGGGAQSSARSPRPNPNVLLLESLVRMCAHQTTCPFMEMETVSSDSAFINIPSLGVSGSALSELTWSCWLNLRKFGNDRQMCLFEAATSSNTICTVTITPNRLRVTRGNRLAHDTVVYELADTWFPQQTWILVTMMLTVDEVSVYIDGERKVLSALFRSPVVSSSATPKLSGRSNKPKTHDQTRCYIGHSNNSSLPVGAHKDCVWWMGPVFLFKTCLTSEQVAMMYDRGPAYHGVFHPLHGARNSNNAISLPSSSQNIDPSTIVFSLHAHYVWQPKTRAPKSAHPNSRSMMLCGDTNTNECIDESSPLQTVVLYSGATDPGVILPNSADNNRWNSTNVHGITTIVGYATGGAYPVNPLPLCESLSMVGGLQCLIVLLAQCRSSTELCCALSVINTWLYGSDRNLKRMAHLRGYKTVGYILKKKEHLLNEKILRTLLLIVYGGLSDDHSGNTDAVRIVHQSQSEFRSQRRSMWYTGAADERTKRNVVANSMGLKYLILGDMWDTRSVELKLALWTSLWKLCECGPTSTEVTRFETDRSDINFNAQRMKDAGVVSRILDTLIMESEVVANERGVACEAYFECVCRLLQAIVESTFVLEDDLPSLCSYLAMGTTASTTATDSMKGTKLDFMRKIREHSRHRGFLVQRDDGKIVPAVSGAIAIFQALLNVVSRVVSGGVSVKAIVQKFGRHMPTEWFSLFFWSNINPSVTALAMKLLAVLLCGSMDYQRRFVQNDGFGMLDIQLSVCTPSPQLYLVLVGLMLGQTSAIHTQVYDIFVLTTEYLDESDNIAVFFPQVLPIILALLKTSAQRLKLSPAPAPSDRTDSNAQMMGVTVDFFSLLIHHADKFVSSLFLKWQDQPVFVHLMEALLLVYVNISSTRKSSSEKPVPMLKRLVRGVSAPARGSMEMNPVQADYHATLHLVHSMCEFFGAMLQESLLNDTSDEFEKKLLTFVCTRPSLMIAARYVANMSVDLWRACNIAAQTTVFARMMDRVEELLRDPSCFEQHSRLLVNLSIFVSTLTECVMDGRINLTIDLLVCSVEDLRQFVDGSPLPPLISASAFMSRFQAGIAIDDDDDNPIVSTCQCALQLIGITCLALKHCCSYLGAPNYRDKSSKDIDHDRTQVYSKSIGTFRRSTLSLAVYTLHRLPLPGVALEVLNKLSAHSELLFATMIVDKVCVDGVDATHLSSLCFHTSFFLHHECHSTMHRSCVSLWQSIIQHRIDLFQDVFFTRGVPNESSRDRWLSGFMLTTVPSEFDEWMSQHSHFVSEMLTLTVHTEWVAYYRNMLDQYLSSHGEFVAQFQRDMVELNHRYTHTMKSRVKLENSRVNVSSQLEQIECQRQDAQRQEGMYRENHVREILAQWLRSYERQCLGGLVCDYRSMVSDEDCVSESHAYTLVLPTADYVALLKELHASVVSDSLHSNNNDVDRLLWRANRWRLDFTEGPLRQRKKLEFFDAFNNTYRLRSEAHSSESELRVPTDDDESVADVENDGVQDLPSFRQSTPDRGVRRYSLPTHMLLQHTSPQFIRSVSMDSAPRLSVTDAPMIATDDGNSSVFTTPTRPIASSLDDSTLTDSSRRKGFALMRQAQGTLQVSSSNEYHDDTPRSNDNDGNENATSLTSNSSSVMEAAKSPSAVSTVTMESTDGGDKVVENTSNEEVGEFAAASLENFANILRLLEPGDELLEDGLYVCARIAGLDQKDGIAVLCARNLYIIEGWALNSEGELEELPPTKTADDASTLHVSVQRGGTDEMPRLFVSRQQQQGSDAILMSKRESHLLDESIFHHHGSQKLSIKSIRELYKRRYQLQEVGIELFQRSGANFLLVFESTEDRNDVYTKLSNSIDSPQITRTISTGMETLKQVQDAKEHRLKVWKKTMTKRWQDGEVSNFAYLMFLNTLAGRSYNDLTQYPVFPWVLADYTSDHLDLTDARCYRDLSKPMGALSAERAEQFQRRFSSWDDPSGTIPPFHYGTHYSSAAGVLYYLLRLEPFTRIHLQLQGGKFDHADRLFFSVERTWKSATADGGMSDVKELIPEFFYLPEFLVNSNNFDMGVTQREVRVNDVDLPPWANGDARTFVRIHRRALESAYVSQHLHEWIDLIFGYKQRGKAAEEAQNVFYYLTYEGTVNIDTIEDPTEKLATIAQINNFGQTPHQLFTRPHPRRNEAVTPVTVATHAQLLKPTILKEMDGYVNSMYWLGDKLMAVTGKRVLLPPKMHKYISFGHPDGSVRFATHLPTPRHRDIDEVLACHENLHDSIQCVATTKDGLQMIVGGEDGIITVWDMCRDWKYRNLTLKASLVAHSDAVTSLVVCSSYGVVVSGGRDGQVGIWDLNRLELVRYVPRHNGEVCAMAVDDASGEIITASGCQVFVWSVNGKCVAQVETSSSMSECVTSVGVARGPEWLDDTVVISGHKNGAVKFWRLQLPSTQGEVDALSTIKQRVTHDHSVGTPYMVLSQIIRWHDVETKGVDDVRHDGAITCIHTSTEVPKKMWTGDCNGRIIEWSIVTDDHWVDDLSVKQCRSCSAPFTLSNRKHHCRRCGDIFCGRCSSKRRALVQFGYSERVRVCDKCAIEPDPPSTIA